MFGNFFSKKTSVSISDKIWISQNAKFAACADMAKLNPNFLFICWFDKSLAELLAAVSDVENFSAVHVSQLNNNILSGKVPVFVEHYPLAAVEQELFQQFGWKEVYVLSGLDEPFFQKFGGDRIISLMEKMGMSEMEEISHPLITKSIANAQKKIAQKVSVEKKGNSQENWFELNMDK